VNIEDIKFGESKTFKKQKALHELTGHFWDFGGQGIMNATNQFFFTNRSVYVLVLHARKDANVSAQITQWVKRIKATGGSSPIIIVANQIDINTGFGFDNKYELQKQFPQIKYFITASCKTEENIELIKNKLEEIIPEAEFLNTSIDERWFELKNILQKETKSKHFLSEERFIEICNNCKLTKKTEQKNAITFLHDLGIVLHFDKVEQYDYFVLDPYWITYGVYQILTSSYAGKEKGVVRMDKLEFIINEEEDKKERYRPANYRKITYTNQQSRFLVEILNEFKLCFCLPDHSQFIIPDLLSTNEPHTITEPIRKAGDSIHFVYEYAYLPKSTMPRIIVETHRIHSEIWRTGCVLQFNDCTALVTNFGNRISIIVTGEHKKKYEFMAVIRFLIDTINQDLPEKPNMMIPLPGTEVFADYEELLDRQKDGQETFTLYKPIKKQFGISVLLEGVASQAEVRHIIKNLDIIKNEVIKINKNVVTIIDKLDTHFEYLINLPDNQQIKENIHDAIEEMNAQQSSEIIKEIMKEIDTAVSQSKGELDHKLNEIYSDLKKTDDVQLKLKLAVPFINVLGINLETEFDVKSWAEKMYRKNELKIFKLMGYL
jgi:internalin A